jgi:hypothetical protein
MFNTDQILSKTDLTDLVEKAGGVVKKNRCACPIHGGHDITGFSIYNDNGRQHWKCFSGDCGGGDAIDFVMVWRGYDFKRACEFLGGDVQADPHEMKRLADERVAKAKAEYEDKQRRFEAARRELQVAERHLVYHQTMGEWARKMWIGRGLDEGMQDFWTLGACEDFVINGDYHTPTLTIPIIGEESNLLNIKHRLVNPQKENDKYRPEKHGLGPFPPFLAIPQMGYDGGMIIVTEGEIKAMVTWASLSEGDIQVIGVPGRSQFKSIAGHLGKQKNVVVIPDPGAEKEALEFARLVNGRYLPTPAKIDDYIIQTNMSANSLYSLLKYARRA